MLTLRRVVRMKARITMVKIARLRATSLTQRKKILTAGTKTLRNANRLPRLLLLSKSIKVVLTNSLGNLNWMQKSLNNQKKD